MKKILIISITIILGACAFPYPHNNWKTPIFTGKVISKETGKSLPEAKIFYETEPDFYTYSKHDGSYTLKAKKEFEFFAVILPTGHPIPVTFNLVASSNQGTATVQVGSCMGDPSFECNGKKRVVNFEVQ